MEATFLRTPKEEVRPGSEAVKSRRALYLRSTACAVASVNVAQ
jgi:hypothetical protein